MGRGLDALGLPPGQLVGANVFDIYGDSPEATGPIRRCLAGEEVYSSVEVRGDAWESRYFPNIVDGQVTGLLGLSINVSAQREAERARREADDRWRSLAENAPDHVFIVDREHRIVFANRGLGSFATEAMVGIHVEEFVPPDRQTGVKAMIDAVFSGNKRQQNFEIEAVSAGETHEYEVRMGPLLTNDDVRGAVLVATDVTEKKRASRERTILEAQVQHRQKLESLGVLAGGIAHDFNNLLVSMMGNADLVAMSLPPEHECRAYVTEITSAAGRAADLCRKMLAYAGKASLELRVISVSELALDMFKLLNVTVGNGVSFHQDIDPDVWPVQADVAQLQQVMLNLVTNASDAMNEGRRVVKLSTGCGDYDDEALAAFDLVYEMRPGAYAYVEVTDSGTGMSEGTKAKMFDPFFTTKAASRGLGMASVLGIVRGHGGGLGVRTALGEGTTVRVFLPRAASGEISRIPQKRPMSHDHGFGAGRFVLVVDDERGVHTVANRALTGWGFKPLSAMNGLEALDVYAKQQGEIALVILDLSMPVLGGLETLVRLKELDPSVNVVLSSGFCDDGAELAKQAKAFLPKPYRLSELRAAVQHAIG